MAIFLFCQFANAYDSEGKESYTSSASTYVVVRRTSELGPTRENPIILSADYIEYRKEENKVLAHGNVKIEDRPVTMECEEAIFDMKEDKIEAKGGIVLRDKNITIHGSQIVYDSRTGRAVIDNASSFISPWYCSGLKIERVSDKEIIVHSGYFTSCELPSPHYRLAAKKVRVLLGNRIYAYKVMMYLGKIPVFYFPFYSHSLRESRLKRGVEFGSSNVEGSFVKTNFGYAFSKMLYGTLLLDYMSRKGVGFGGKLDYISPDKIKRFLYGYYIDEKDTGKKRGAIQGEDSENLGSDFYFQMKLNYMSDQAFNKDYNEENWLPMTEELDSTITLTRLTPIYTLRIVGEKKDEWDVTTGRFANTYTYSPQFSFATNLLQIKDGLLYYKLGVDYTNMYSRLFDYSTRLFQETEGHYLNQSDIYFDLVNKLRLSRWENSITEVGFQEKWQDKDEDWNRKNVYTNVYTAQENLRTQVTRSFYTDLTYNFEQDQGKTTIDKLSLLGRIHLLQLLEFESSTGYSFIGETNLRFDNLFSRVDFTPSRLATFYMDYSYDLNTERTANFQTEGIFGPGGKKWSINARLTYLEGTSVSPHRLDIVNGFNLPIGDKWGIRPNIRYDITNHKIMERGIHIYRDLHCWEAKLSYTKIPDKQEIWFTVNLKVLPEEIINLYHNVKEKE
jgi:lipopolysaccharide assembly outer membrane protein LptD (OstA)